MTNPATPIRLGALAPLSRPGFLEAGHQLRAGIVCAVDEINEAGGINGRPLELQLRDSAGDPALAETAIREFAKGDAVAVVGEYHSVVAHAAASAAVDAGLPFVCSSAVLDGLVDKQTEIVARIAPPQSYCWRVYADYLMLSGHQHIVVLIQPNRYWSAGEQVLEAALSEHGVTVTRVDSEMLATAPISNTLTAVGADALLLLVGYPEPAISVVRSVREDPRLTGVQIGDPAGRAECSQWLELLGEQGADIAFLRYMPPELDTLGKRVSEKLAEMLGGAPSFVALEGYDSVQVVVEALRVGGPDRQGVLHSLRTLTVAGTRGMISFSGTTNGILQWMWPPVQVVARAPNTLSDLNVLHQADSADSQKQPRRRPCWGSR